jgi:hypothetical protein
MGSIFGTARESEMSSPLETDMASPFHVPREERKRRLQQGIISGIEALILFTPDPPEEEDSWVVVPITEFHVLPPMVHALTKLTTSCRFNLTPLKYKANPNCPVSSYIFSRVEKGKYPLNRM